MITKIRTFSLWSNHIFWWNLLTSSLMSPGPNIGSKYILLKLCIQLFKLQFFIFQLLNSIFLKLFIKFHLINHFIFFVILTFNQNSILISCFPSNLCNLCGTITSNWFIYIRYFNGSYFKIWIDFDHINWFSDRSFKMSKHFVEVVFEKEIVVIAVKFFKEIN